MSAPTFEITTASPAHSSHSTASDGSIQPMHPQQSEQQQPLEAKSFLMKKMAQAGGAFHSPTDAMVSPCTKKLAQSKQRHFTKGKPLSLSSSFQAQQQQHQQAPGAAQKKPSGLGQSSTLGSENEMPF
ncbi:spo12 family protein [Rhodotorula toruloides]|uniref:Spo12 family protein n=1 Tax=Rhodotorula toruloides TaxID=5286 RepID=A0A511KB85_RHOTO|nr:spo12 family protein [Rhodotorula toruloides]